MGNFIKVEDIKENISTTYITSDFGPMEFREQAYSYGVSNDKQSNILIDTAAHIVESEVNKEITNGQSVNLSQEQIEKVKHKVLSELSENKSLSEPYQKNSKSVSKFIADNVEKLQQAAKKKFIPIPKMKIIDSGTKEYGFVEFDLNLSEFNHVPSGNDLLIQNLEDASDLLRIQGDKMDFTDYNPKKAILDILQTKPEIDYEKCSTLLFKLISEATDYYTSKYDFNAMCNIVMMNKKDIANKIYNQMMQDEHFYSDNSSIKYAVAKICNCNIQQNYTWKQKLNLYDNLTENITSILFDGIKKAVFSSAKFDSLPELILARVLERDAEVIKWLRPAQNEFNITYNRGRRYVPDFVVETEQCFYIVEVKGEDKLNDADVIAKEKQAIKFCEVASEWSKQNNKKEWKYVFIPSKEIQPTSTYSILAKRFCQG